MSEVKAVLQCTTMMADGKHRGTVTFMKGGNGKMSITVVPDIYVDEALPIVVEGADIQDLTAFMQANFPITVQ
jgi:hypothetical protein